MKKLSTMLIMVVVVALSGAAQAATRSLVFAWDPNPGPDIAGYIFYERVRENHFPVAVIAPSRRPSYTITELSRGTHYFSITAFNTAGGESDYSVEVAFIH